jgi:hypothetical protein
MQHIPQPQQVLLQQGRQPLLARGERVAVQEDAVVVQLRLQLGQPAAGGQQQLGLQGAAGSREGRGSISMQLNARGRNTDTCLAPR